MLGSFSSSSFPQLLQVDRFKPQISLRWSLRQSEGPGCNNNERRMNDGEPRTLRRSATRPRFPSATIASAELEAGRADPRPSLHATNPCSAHEGSNPAILGSALYFPSSCTAPDSNDFACFASHALTTCQMKPPSYSTDSDMPSWYTTTTTPARKFSV